MTRVYDDIHFMVYWVTEATNETSAALLDPLVRSPLTTKFAKHLDIIEKIAELRGVDLRKEMERHGLVIETPKPKGKPQ